MVAAMRSTRAAGRARPRPAVPPRPVRDFATGSLGPNGGRIDRIVPPEPDNAVPAPGPVSSIHVRSLDASGAVLADNSCRGDAARWGPRHGHVHRRRAGPGGSRRAHAQQHSPAPARALAGAHGKPHRLRRAALTWARAWWCAGTPPTRTGISSRLASSSRATARTGGGPSRRGPETGSARFPAVSSREQPGARARHGGRRLQRGDGRVRALDRGGPPAGGADRGPAGGSRGPGRREYSSPGWRSTMRSSAFAGASPHGSPARDG